jgi:tRNA (guanine-N7-)-methyltransferase
VSSAETKTAGGPVVTPHQQRLRERQESLSTALGRILPAQSAITWEVGCGHGHFLTAYAAANPSKLCVGIDIMGERIARATRKRDRASLKNLHFIHAEAGLFLSTLPAGTEISEIFILFPDPWPKVRHHKHRILSSSFLTATAARSKPHAQLCFRTDYSPYFESAVQTLAQHHDWQITSEAWPFEYTSVFQTRAPSFQSFIARRRPISVHS